MLALEIGERADHVVFTAKVLVTWRREHAGPMEDVTTAALGAEVSERRVAAVERNAETHGERALERGRREAGQVR